MRVVECMTIRLSIHEGLDANIIVVLLLLIFFWMSVSVARPISLILSPSLFSCASVCAHSFVHMTQNVRTHVRTPRKTMQ